MRILILCGVFAEENASEVMKHARRAVEFSANTFQEKLVQGFTRCGELIEVISAPFIGSFPNASDWKKFNGFYEKQSKYTYVNFNNIWGIRNLSRSYNLKKSLQEFISSDDENKLILVYSAHTPFLEAASYAKKRDSRIKICLYVPDLPNYMNLSADRSCFYDFAKKIDIHIMYRHMKSVDSFVLLTEHMKDILPIDNKPCLVVEGIVDEINPDICQYNKSEDNEKYIVYTGKLDEKFGIKFLIEAFSLTKNESFRLVLCGKGDCDSFIKRAVQEDSRIIATGQVTPQEAKEWQKNASILINPRPNNEVYTKYSFPSKTIEYLLTGKPVVAYMLDGMPICYKNYLHIIDDKLLPKEAIEKAINEVVVENIEYQKERYNAFYNYANQNLLSENIARNIINLGR